MGIRALGRAGAEADFSKNHHISQRLLGLIIGGLNIRVFGNKKRDVRSIFPFERDG